jgi:hypothetical protein
MIEPVTDLGGEGPLRLPGARVVQLSAPPATYNSSASPSCNRWHRVAHAARRITRDCQMPTAPKVLAADHHHRRRRPRLRAAAVPPWLPYGRAAPARGLARPSAPLDFPRISPGPALTLGRARAITRSRLPFNRQTP